MAPKVRSFKEASLTLLYGDFHFWRAEAPRIALFIADKDFEDKRLSDEEFDKLQNEEHTLPFGQVPVLLVDGKPIAQTFAICSYIGKNTDLSPKNDFLAAKVDELICYCSDVTDMIVPSAREQDIIRRASMRQELAEQKLPKALRQLDRLIQDNGDGNFFTGQSLTIADLCAWRLIGWIASGALDGIPVTITKNFQRVNRCYWKVNKDPKVVEWMRKFPELYKDQ